MKIMEVWFPYELKNGFTGPDNYDGRTYPGPTNYSYYNKSHLDADYFQRHLRKHRSLIYLKADSMLVQRCANVAPGCHVSCDSISYKS